MSNLEQIKKDLIAEIERRQEDRIIENTNAQLLIKLIKCASNVNEAISIAQLGTTYKRTGFHFDKRLEKMTNTIKYLKKNDELSFKGNENKPKHKLIIGDNYDALLNLLIEYTNRIDLIYIDPPYGKDSMGEFAQVNYTNSLTRDNLLSMLYPRLLLAQQLLNDDGFIFISIDDKNEAYIKCLCDEIFSEINFRTVMTVVANPGGRDYGGIAKTTEFVLVYSKNPEPLLVKIDSEEHNFTLSDEYGKFELRELRNRNTKFNDQNRPNLCYPFFVDENNIDKHGLYHISLEQDDKHKIKVMPLKSQGIQTVWRWGKEERARKNLNINIKAKRKKDGTFMIVEKYRDEKVMLKNLLSDKVFRTENGSLQLKSIFNDKVFDYPKPIEIPKTLIQTYENKDAIILDFFAGSGTTGHAVMQLNREDEGNREFILCTNNEITSKTPKGIAYDVTAKRLKRIMTGECYNKDKSFEWLEKNEPYGGSLDVLEIDFVSNFENTPGKSVFEVIDETVYDLPKFRSIREKIDWVCNNFEITQKSIENDKQYKERMEEM